MPVRDRFEALTKRSYRQAIVHMLETEYKIIGSHRVLQQLAEDVEALSPPSCRCAPRHDDTVKGYRKNAS
jgi:hypothetical protein